MKTEISTLEDDEDDDDGASSLRSEGIIEVPGTTEDEHVYILPGLEEDQNQEESESGAEQFNCSIDELTGNIIYSNERELENSTGRESTSSEQSESVAVLRMLDNGEYVIDGLSEEEGPASEENIVHFTEEVAPEGEDEDLEELEEEPRSELRVSNVTSMARTETGGDSGALANLGSRTFSRVFVWSRRKIMDLIKCIHVHEYKFRKRIKRKNKIWDDVSNDMVSLGHRDCNRDECSKKWSNLHRTWRKVRQRPRETRGKWEFYEMVTTLVKSLSARNRDKLPMMKKQSNLTTSDFILKLMESTRESQQAIEAAEEKFKRQVEALNEERDEILGDIRRILVDTPGGSGTKSLAALEAVESFHLADQSNPRNVIPLLEDCRSKSSPIYFKCFRKPRHIDLDNSQFRLVTMESVVTQARSGSAESRASPNSVEQ